MLSYIKDQNALNWAKLYLTISTSAFIFFSVTFLNSYNICFALLIFSYLFFFSANVRQQINLSSMEKGLIAAMFIYISAFIMEVVVFDEKARLLDKPAKVLLLIPLVLLLNAVKVNYRYLVAAFIASSGLLFLAAIYDTQILGYGRAGQDMNAIQFGAIAIAIAATALALTLTGMVKNRGLLTLLVLVAAGGIVAGILSQSRGSILAIPVIALLLGFLLLTKLNLCKFKSSIGILVLLIASGIALYNSPIKERFQRSIDNTMAYKSGENTNTSSGIRLAQWQISLEAGTSSPMFGVGHSQFVAYKDQQVELGRFGEELLGFDNSHNSYANAFARRGIIGLITVILFLGLPIYCGIQAWRNNSASVAPYAAGLTAFGSVFFIANITQEIVFLNTGIIMYTGLLVILTSLLADRIKAADSSTAEPDKR